jgi:hypothetical protein
MRGQLLPHFAYLGADHVCWILLSSHAEIELDPIGNARFISYPSVTRRIWLGSLWRDFLPVNRNHCGIFNHGDETNPNGPAAAGGSSILRLRSIRPLAASVPT